MTKLSLLSIVVMLPASPMSSPQLHPANQEAVLSGQSGITMEGYRFAEQWEEEQRENRVHTEDKEQGVEMWTWNHLGCKQC